MTKLADLLSDPSKIGGLSCEIIPQLRGELAQLDTLLLSRLLSAGQGYKETEDQLLEVSEAAKRLGVSPITCTAIIRNSPLPIAWAGNSCSRLRE